MVLCTGHTGQLAVLRCTNYTGLHCSKFLETFYHSAHSHLLAEADDWQPCWFRRSHWESEWELHHCEVRYNIFEMVWTLSFSFERCIHTINILQKHEQTQINLTVTKCFAWIFEKKSPGLTWNRIHSFLPRQLWYGFSKSGMPSTSHAYMENHHDGLNRHE